MTLFDKNKFYLDQDISDFLGYKVRNPNFPDTPITIKSVLSHTSSIQECNAYYDFQSFCLNQEKVEYIPNLSQLLLSEGKWYSQDLYGNKPQGYFNYCNLNFVIIGTIIEVISQQRFDLFMQNNILNPLNITGSFNQALIQDWEDICTNYEGENNQWKPVKDFFISKPQQQNLQEYIPGTNGILFGPQAGCFIRLKELIQIMKILYQDEQTLKKINLSQQSVQLMINPVWKFNGNNGNILNEQVLAYGLGVMISDYKINFNNFEKTIKIIGHFGNDFGAISDIWFNPNDQKGLIFGINGALNGYRQLLLEGFSEVEIQIMDFIYKYFESFQK